MSTDRDPSGANYRNEMDRESDSYTPAANYNYRNGLDVESDNYVARVAGSGLRIGGASNSGLQFGDSTAAAWSNQVDAGIKDGARALANWDAAASKVWAQEDAESAARARAAIPEQNRRADVYRRELAEASQRAKWDAMQVGGWNGRTNQVVPVSSSSGNYSPELDHSYYVKPGFIASSYSEGVAMMSDSAAPWYDRLIGGVAATTMAPMMLLEETGRAMMNVPYYGRQAGQNAAQFTLADSTEGRVVAGLSFVSNASAGFLSAGAMVPGSVSMRAPVLTAQEMAITQFPGAEATAAARASYSPATQAASWQGAGLYPGVDRYRNITLQEGTYLIGATPGQGNYYTTLSGMRRTELDAVNYYQGLQVAPNLTNPSYDVIRDGLTVYRVTETQPAAFGRALANTQHGLGGLPQVFVPDFTTLEVVDFLPFNNKIPGVKP